MPVAKSNFGIGTDVSEIRGECEICGEVKKIEKWEWTDKRGITHCSDLWVCRDCLEELYVFDQSYHAGDFGARFSDITGNGFDLDNVKVSNIVSRSEWGEIQDRADHKRIIARDWDDLDSALRED